MEEEPEHDLWVRADSASFVFVPETFHFDANYTVADFWQDLVDLALRDHVQYPTAVFFTDESEGTQNGS